MSTPTTLTSVYAAGLAALLLATAVVYSSSLDSAPVYVAPDEAHFAAHAGALAEHGTDLNGHRLPVFFRITDPLIPADAMRVWYQPTLFYLLAATFAFLPVTEASARLPVVALGVANVFLMFLVGRRLFKSDRVALLGAAALAMTPAHFLFSRQAVDYICPLPVVLGWLWCLLGYQATRHQRYLTGAMLLLGAGLFTYISSWAVMPLLGVLTLVAVKPPRRSVIQAVVAFALPTIALLPWLLQHDQVLSDIVARYGLVAPAGTLANSTRSWLDFNLAERVSLYWNYFNPSFLFFAGGGDLMMATSRAGVFLLPLAPLVAWGTYTLWKRRSVEAAVLLCGFYAAPLPIVLALPETPQSSIGRALTMVVFGVLIAMIGAQALWHRSTVSARAGVVALLLLMPLQFLMFRADYLSAYQERSAVRFDPFAMRDVMGAILDIERRTAVPLILINDDGDNKAIRWKFYTLKHQRTDLWSRTKYFRVDALDSAGPPMGSLLLMAANDPRSDKLLAAGCSKIAVVDGRGGQPATDIFRRER